MYRCQKLQCDYKAFLPHCDPPQHCKCISTEKIISTIIHVPVCMHLTPFYIMQVHGYVVLHTFIFY